MANLLPSIRQPFFDADGNPLVGGKLYSYAAGTTTPLATYVDSTGVIENTNPIILDANGEASIWIGQSAYKFVLHDAEDVEQWTVDGVILIDAESVTTAKLAPLSVTTAKINDGAVTTVKINNLAVTTAKIANSAITTEKINDSAVTESKIADGAITTAKFNTAVFSDILTEKNKLINGRMEVWQRGTSFTPSGSLNFTADRWASARVGTNAYSVELSTDAPSYADAGVTYYRSMKITCTTAEASPAATSRAAIMQPIEGTFFSDLIQKPFVFSFWIKSTKTGTFPIAFKNGFTEGLVPATKSYIATYTVNVAGAWERKVIAVPAPTDGTWYGGSGAAGLCVNFTLMAGSNFQTTSGAWQNGDYLKSSTTGNLLDSTSNVVYITGCSLEGGLAPKQNDARDPGIELIMCQRFFERLYPKFLAYNPNVSVSNCIGGRVPFVSWRNQSIPTISSTTVTATRVNSVSVTFSFFNGAEVQGSFETTGAAGQAVLDLDIKIDSELEY